MTPSSSTPARVAGSSGIAAAGSAGYLVPPGAATPRIRLMQITHDLQVGGLQRVVVTLCRAIDPERFDVSVLCLREAGPLARELESIGVPVITLPRDPHRTDYFAFRRVARVLRERQISVVHTHNTEPFVDGGIAARLAGVRTLVHTDHARDFPDKVRYMLAEHVMAWNAYRVVGVSEDTTRNLAHYERIPRRKLVTITNGIDGEPYSQPLDRARLRQELGIAGDGPVIGLGARLVEQKGITYLLQAMRVLRDRVPGLTCMVAGEGPLEAELRAEAGRLGVGDSVRFLGVRLDMPRLIRAFDVYVLPSVWEGLPMAVLEALAAGCPVVASNVGGVGAALTDGVTGSLVPPRDPAALAGAIESLLRDEARRSRYAGAGRTLFNERFSAESMARKYEKLYLREAD